MSKIFEIPCVILCGGKSRRMGEDKSLLPFGGEDSLASYQYKRLKPFFQDIYISCKDSSIYDFEAEFIIDKEKDFNPFNGILSSFEHINLPYIFFIPVDSPFFTIESFEKILKSLGCTYDGAIAKEEDKTHNLIGIYSISLKPKIEELIKEQNYRVGALIQRCNFAFVDFENSEEFLNLNRKDEYQKALEIGFSKLLT